MNIDIIDRLVWMGVNTLDNDVDDLCLEAREEIKRLRTALALAVGELSAHDAYRVWSPDQLLEQFMEEACRG